MNLEERLHKEEVFESGMERLRREFVQRGSRAASGSRAEEVGLEFVTSELRGALPGLRLPFERAASTAAGRLFEELPYWQEARLERSLKVQFPGVALSPAHLLTPLPDAHLLPPLDADPESGDALAAQAALLTPEESARFRAFVMRAREELPRLMEPEFRTLSRTSARRWLDERPAVAGGLSGYVGERRGAFVDAATERWRRVGAVAQKQTADWLRTAAFTLKLAQGARDRLKELDATLGELSSGWRLERQVAVDRNILRLAGFEMLYLPNIPTGASINEAVELAKKYSTQESGRFVNGVLGALAARVGDKLPGGAGRDETEADAGDAILDLPDVTGDPGDEDDRPTETTLDTLLTEADDE